MKPDQGPIVTGDGVRFRVWAPLAPHVDLQLVAPRRRVLPMERAGEGYHELFIPGLRAGARYLYRLEGGQGLPDPASRLQPLGVHGPSQVVDPAYPWPRTRWKGLAPRDHVFYELHVGTFSKRGTFAGIRPHLRSLRELGITTIEVMPVNAFPGRRNWGYDGVAIFAVQSTYGGPRGLKDLVAAAHAEGLAVILDVVYNHFGPEGAYLHKFGPYFTEHHHTPWGRGLNFDGAGSGPVRRFFLDNVRQWIEEFRLDGLRLDAVHAILDDSPRHILAEMSAQAHAIARAEGRRVVLATECSSNDDWMVVPERRGGRGMDATWADDFHHAFDVNLSRERKRWPRDYRGMARVAGVLQRGTIYHDILPDEPVGRPQPPASLVPPRRHVVFTQNHDQVGNRPPFQRFAPIYGLEVAKMSAAATLLGPHIPLLFMGEEYGEPAPFRYFTDHGDPDLVDAVRKGRIREFPYMQNPPDPQDPATFTASRLDHRLARRPPHNQLRAYYQELLRLRRKTPALQAPSAKATAQAHTVILRSRMGARQAMLLLHWSPEPRTIQPKVSGSWTKALDSAHGDWAGPGATAPDRLAGKVRLQPWNAVLYRSGP